MRILWLTWKDTKNPLAGGAEVVHHEIAKRLVADGHEVTILTSGFSGALATEKRDGYKVIRVGGRHTVYWHAYRYYKKHFVGWADLVIDEMNTVPFFAKSYVRERNMMMVHQLCREIWFHEMPFPLSIIGYVLEPLYLKYLNDREVITVSESTKTDLMRYGFSDENVHIISEGTTITPVENLEGIQKWEKPTILALGAVRAMKRTDDIVRAFERVKDDIPEARLVVAGDTSGAYGQKVLRRIERSQYRADIDVLGRVSPSKKKVIMQKAHVIAVASVKEGWGLVVTEAASQGTLAVVYDADGLRDSVEYEVTGLITEKNTPEHMRQSLTKILSDDDLRATMSTRAWHKSKEITFEKCYADFLKFTRIKV